MRLGRYFAGWGAFVGLVAVLGSGLSGARLAAAEVIGPSAPSIAPPLASLQAEARLKPGQTGKTEVLLRQTAMQIAKDRRASSRTYMAIRLGDADAVRDYSQLIVPFNAHYEDLQLDFARVLTPAGETLSLAADALQIRQPANENFYQDGKELTFSLPGLSPGAVIEFQYSRRDKTAIMPGSLAETFWLYWWQERAGNLGTRLDSVRHRIVEVIAPSDLPLYWSPSHEAQFTLKKTPRPSGETLYRFEWKHAEALVIQPWMPRQFDALMPSVAVSTDNRWQAVATWADSLIAPHTQANAELKAIAAQLAKTALTPAAKAKAVYQFLDERVRYVFAHVGRGGYEPHSAAQVLHNGYGDCKDQTVLAVTLLRELGVEVYPALVATRNMGLPRLPLPSVNFDHMIIYLPAQGDLAETWMDTAGEGMLYPGFSLGIEGQPALVIRPETDAIRLLPLGDAKAHGAHWQVTYQPTPRGWEADFTLRPTGYLEQSLRSQWIFQPEKQKYLTDQLAGLAGSGQLLAVAGHNAKALFEPFYVTGRLRAPPSEGQPLLAFHIAQLLQTFVGAHQWHKPEERLQPFEWSPGLSLSAEVSFPAGDGWQALSRSPSVKTPWYQLQQDWQEKPQHLVARAYFELPSLSLTRKDYAAFHHAIMGLQQEPAFVVQQQTASARVVKPDARDKANTALTPSDSASQAFQAIRDALTQGAFEAALEQANQAAAQYPKSGEALYLLGLAQGYNDQLEDSEKSLQSAKALGYQP